MFEIKAWISDYLDEISTITVKAFDKDWYNVSGYVQVDIGEHQIGYFPMRPAMPGQTGDEWVNWWLESFLQCANKISETKYVAFPMPESNLTWLEFELVDTRVIFNLAEYGGCELKGLIITEKFNGFTYVEPLGVEIEYADFLKEIKRASMSFFNELESINPSLMNSKMAIDMLHLFDLL